MTLIKSNSEKMEIIRKFNELINRHFLEEHDISFYEAQLGLKPKYLSKLSKKKRCTTAMSSVTAKANFL
ncbi:MAG: hypothetical protein ABJM36_02815 [Algibacter sp.]|uniref:hypothetical protein n=1 Tax=Algibacter sp. TaxID=1872428 RepID=UPI003298035D